MPKRWIKKITPSKETLEAHPHLQRIYQLCHHPALFHINRNSVADGIAIGLFMAFLPVPFQMVLAAIVAIYFHANLPISVVTVWVSNPLTMPPLFYFAYLVGLSVLNIQAPPFEFTLSFFSLIEQLGERWWPFIFGCLICGFTAALLGNVLVRVIWRWYIRFQWMKRKRAD